MVYDGLVFFLNNELTFMLLFNKINGYEHLKIINPKYLNSSFHKLIKITSQVSGRECKLQALNLQFLIIIKGINLTHSVLLLWVRSKCKFNMR